MLDVRAVDERFKRSQYDLRGSGTEVIHHRLLGEGSSGQIFRSSWFWEDFASKCLADSKLDDRISMRWMP